jgi:hypothetical protein
MLTKILMLLWMLHAPMKNLIEYDAIKVTETYRILDTYEYISDSDKYLISDAIEKTSIEKELNQEDKAIVLAVAFQESRFTKEAVGSSGECGLYQQIPKWLPNKEVREMDYDRSCEYLKNPYSGTREFINTYRHLKKRYKQDWPCHYNQGIVCGARGYAYLKNHYRLRRQFERQQDRYAQLN